MKLTEEQYNKIQEYEKDFHHALYENYFRIINRKLLVDYAAIYKSVFNRDSKILNGCSRCILADIKQLAKVYFDDKAEKEAQKEAEMPVNEPETQPEAKEQQKKAQKTTKTAKNKKK